MPSLKLFTNLHGAMIPNDFVSKILPVLARCVNKPVERFVVTIVPDCIQSVHGDCYAPAVVATIESIGNLGPNENKIIAKDITNFIEAELCLNRNRIVIDFIDRAAHNVAKAGVTLG